jgi:hypothetical protein
MLHFHLPIGHGVNQGIEAVDRDWDRAAQFYAAVFAQQQNGKLIFRHLKTVADGGKFFLAQQRVGRIKGRIVICRFLDDWKEEDEAVHRIVGRGIERGLLLDEARITRAGAEDKQWTKAVAHLSKR